MKVSDLKLMAFKAMETIEKDSKLHKQRQRSLLDMSSGIFYMEKLDLIKEHVPYMHDAVSLLKEKSALGKKLYDWAVEENIPIRLKDIEYLGLWDGYIVTIHSDIESPDIIAFLIAHELMHAIQYSNGLDKADKDWDIRSFIKRSMCLEAGAVLCQTRIAYEMKLNGYDEVWNSLLFPSGLENQDLLDKIKPYGTIARIFEAAYKSSQEKGDTAEQSMEYASKKTYEARLESQELKDRYNNQHLSFYFRRVSGFLAGGKRKNIEAKELIIKSVECIKGEFLANAEDIKAPEQDSDLFGNNILMRQASDFLEAQRENYRLKKGDFHPSDDGRYFLFDQDKASPFKDMNYQKLRKAEAENAKGKKIEMLDFMTSFAEKEKKPAFFRKLKF